MSLIRIKNLIFVFFFSSELVKEFVNNFIKDLIIPYVHNKEIHKINQGLLYCIDVRESTGYKISNINQMNIKTINDRCNMTYENYINQPKSMCERKINMNLANKPQAINLFDRNKNHRLVKKNLVYLLITNKCI